MCYLPSHLVQAQFGSRLGGAASAEVDVAVVGAGTAVAAGAGTAVVAAAAVVARMAMVVWALVVQD